MTEGFLFFGNVLAPISVLVNLLLVWYIRRVMKRSSLMCDITTDMLTALEDFSTHIEQVYELPLFYGDETIKELMGHSKEIVKYTRQYRDGFVFGAEGEQDDRESEEGSSQEE